MSQSSSTPLTKISMPQASGDLWNAGNVMLICREIMLKNKQTVLLLLFTVIFLKELVLELIERPLVYMVYMLLPYLNKQMEQMFQKQAVLINFGLTNTVIYCFFLQQPFHLVMVMEQLYLIQKIYQVK